MTKKITIASHKGGVGKTTTALNLGFSMSRLGKKVLVVDADLQGGVAVACNLVAKTPKGIIHVLRDDLPLAEAIFHLDQEKRLAILGAGIEIPEDIVYFEEQTSQGRLQTLFQGDFSAFDYVLFDAPAGIGVITKELLTVSDSMIHVINCRASTVKSIAKLLRLFIWIRKTINAEIKLSGILISGFKENDPVEEKFLQIIRSRLPANLLFHSLIPYDDVFEKASIKAVPVGRMAQGQKATKSYQSLAEELVSREQEASLASLSDDMGGVDQDLDDIQTAPELGSLDIKNDKIHEILVDLCDNGECHGALVADEMGFLLADYHTPLAVDSLAAYSSVLGEALVKADSLIDMPEANNLVLDMNDADKIVLRWCSILGERYFLMAICPQEADVLGEIEHAAGKIVSELSE
ncbi:MAG: ParA family protein [Proteobacteria bacterium]|nr:ParA family protein [Pseudomonadota bacterium]MBU1687814.1 ParA family protein [Pseudomonadota bacterium]